MGAKVKTLSVSQLTLGAHIAFHDTVCALAEAAPESLGLGDLIADYRPAIGVVMSVVGRQRASVYTDNLNAADHARDAAVGVVMRLIDAHATSPDALLSEAAKDLQVVVAPYRGMREWERMAQSSGIETLLAALASTPHVLEAVEALKLADHIARIRSTAAEFERLNRLRYEEWETLAPITAIDTRAARRTADTLWGALADRLNALSLIGTPTRKKAADELIAAINSRVDHYRTIIANSRRVRPLSRDNRLARLAARIADAESHLLALRAEYAELAAAPEAPESAETVADEVKEDGEG